MMTPIPKCAVCFDVGWVCENHPMSPWDRTKPAGCECGAGMPCPSCFPSDVEHPPRSSAGMKIDADKSGSRH